ncbi:MAG: FAD-binding oxidoreductase [Desulfobacterales bacterium]|nr:FAD-binding oxidoreductase [Desulfobacterales bacterium]
MKKKFDAVIIGAGISGAAIAHELSKKGYRTVNVDRLPAAGQGSTSNTCAIIRTHYSTLEGTAIAYDSYFSWRNWKNYLDAPDEKGLARLHQTGLVNIYPKEWDPSNYLKLHDELGIPYEIWNPAKLLGRMPHFVDASFYPPARPEDPRFDQPPEGKINDMVIYYPNDGYINDPVLSVHNIQRAAESKGGAFLFNEEVVEIRRDDHRVIGVTLESGKTIDAAVVVNAAGPHSAVINRMAGVEKQMNIKTRALRHEVHFAPSPDGFSYEKDGLVVGDADLGGYHRPETGNLILVGSEDPSCDEREWIDNPDHFNQEPTLAQYQAQTYRLAKRAPGLRIPNIPKGIADLYDVSDDWIPIYDRSSLDGFYLAIGTSGNQYKNGPVIGLLLAEIIDACENGHDHDRNPVEVNLRNIDFRLNTGFFSRNRDIIEGSTFSVLG